MTTTGALAPTCGPRSLGPSGPGCWYMYVVRCSDGSLYCGITMTPRLRTDQHNGLAAGGAKYTRSRRPVKLVYKEEHPDCSTAAKAEAAFKKLSRPEKQGYIAPHLPKGL